MPQKQNLGRPIQILNRQSRYFQGKKTRSFTSIFYHVSSIKEAATRNTFVIVDAQIHNSGADRITVFPHRFSIGDSDGNRFDKEPHHGSDWLMSGELTKNHEKKGKVLFEIPQKSKELVSDYDLNGRFIILEKT